MQEVAVVQRLQAEVTELQVAIRLKGLTQARQVEFGQARVEQFALDATLDELLEVGRVARTHGLVAHLLADHFLADRIQQQARGHVAIGRVFLKKRAGGEDCRLVHLFHRHAVVQVPQGGFHDDVGGRDALQAHAGRLQEAHEPLRIQRLADAGLGDVDRIDGRLLLGDLLLRARAGPILAVQHIGAGNVVLARTHQRELHLVLDVFNMEGAAGGLAPHQRTDHRVCQSCNELAHAGRTGALAAVDGQERLGQRDGDLGGFEADDRSVATDDLVVGVNVLRRDPGFRKAHALRGIRCCTLLRNLHVLFSSNLSF